MKITPRPDDRARIHAKGLECPHKRLCTEEIDGSLRMRCTGKCEQEKGRRHAANGLAKAALERLGGPH